MGTLDVGETWTYTATYSVTQNDIDRGTPLVNTATVDTDQTTPASDTATTTISTTSSLTITKTVDLPSISAPGLLTYTIVVVNTGTTSLTGIDMSDVLPDGTAGTLTGPTGDGGTVGTLDVGETWTYTATYAVTQNDIDRGTPLVNTATVDTDQTTPASDTATTTISTTSSLTITKTVDLPSISAPGLLTYTIVVVNTGTTSLTGIDMSDVLPDGTAGTLTGPTGDGGTVGTLDVGETWTYTATYAVTQNDIDRGTPLVNTATVDTDQTTPASDTATTTISTTSSLTITKTVDLSSISAPGLLTYTIVVVNTGTTSLTGIDMSDVLPDGTAGTLTGPTGDGGTVGTLDVGETWTYTATYAVTQNDIDRGTPLVNTATVDTDQTTPASDTATTTISTTSSLTITKTVDLSSISAPGLLTYTIVVVNTGTTSLTGIDMSDVLPDGTAGTLTGPTGDGGAVGTLDVGETWTYSATYAVTQNDIDRGTPLVNTATVDTDQTTPASDTATTTISTTSSLTITKTVDLPSISAPGLLTYTIVVVNTGTTSLTGIDMSDVLPDGTAGTLTGPTGDGGAVGTLDVGETWTYTATYAVTQNDIDRGTPLVNTATVDTDQTTPASDTATTTISTTSSLTITKTVDLSSISAPGLLTYTIVVVNTGTTSLTGMICQMSCPMVLPAELPRSLVILTVVIT